MRASRAMGRHSSCARKSAQPSQAKGFLRTHVHVPAHDDPGCRVHRAESRGSILEHAGRLLALCLAASGERLCTALTQHSAAGQVGILGRQVVRRVRQLNLVTIVVASSTRCFRARAASTSASPCSWCCSSRAATSHVAPPACHSARTAALLHVLPCSLSRCLRLHV